MKPLKIFIVDDDPDFAEGVAITLEIAGHEVTFAHSGEEAVRRFQKQDFDITFMDVRMPGMNGVDSFFEIRKNKPEAKVIMMTAYSVEELLNRAIDGGALGVLHKPFGAEEILQAVESAKPAGIILLADDDPDFVEGVEQMLTNAGYHLMIAKDGKEAVEKVLTETFDVLLLDLRLPILNGLGVYQELKKQGRALPTIIVTGFDVEEAETIDALTAMSATGCLVKPIASNDLLQAVEKVMSNPAEKIL
jgi:CheY-like chemotaxis protein